MQADDYFAIQNLLFSYPSTLDRGDFDGVGQIFRHANFYIAGQLICSKDPAAVAKSFRDWVLVYSDGTPRTRHCISNVVIRPEGNDRATVSSYVIVFQQTDTLPLQPVIGGDYLDTVQKVDGNWRFIERRIGNDLVGNLIDHGRDPKVVKPTRANG